MTDTISPQLEKSEALFENEPERLGLMAGKSPFIIIIGASLGLILLGSILISYIIDANATRTEDAWRHQLTVISENKANALQQWLVAEQKALQVIANSPELQNYLRAQNALSSSILENSGIQRKSPVNSEPQFLSIHYQLQDYARALDAFSNNLTTPSESYGLILLDREFKPIVSTQNIPGMQTHILEQLNIIDKTIPSVASIAEAKNGMLFLGFNTPITMHGIENPEIIGYILGLKPLSQDLNSIFAFGNGIANAISVKLVKANSNTLEVISFDKKNNDALNIGQVPNDPQTSNEAFALSQPGLWLHSDIGTNTPVYITSTHVQNSPWTVIASIPESYAMAANKEFKHTMYMVLFAFSVIMAMLVVVIYSLASSKKVLHNSRHFRALARQSHLQEMLLKTVANSQPEALFLLDSNFRFRYANYHAAKLTNTPTEKLLGKTIADVMGQAKAQTITNLATDAMNSQRTQTLMLSVQKDGKERAILRTLIPIFTMSPGDEALQSDPHVLITDRDITEVTEARERRLKLNGELVELLVALMDQRDQHATNHSRHVAELASSIAKTMDLNQFTQTHVYYAGLLMNIGKMIVPERWLNSHELLDEKSVETIRQSLRASSQILNKLDFDKEVILALRQAHEYIDGSGAIGLKGEEICLEGRIITVANAAISMLSPRSWRPAMKWGEVAKILNEEADVKYDRGVIAALVNYMENMGGKSALKITSKAA